MQRLMARAAAGDDPDLPGDRGLGADHELLLEIDPHQVGVRRGDARERLGDDVIGCVDELLDGWSAHAHVPLPNPRVILSSCYAAGSATSARAVRSRTEATAARGFASRS